MACEHCKHEGSSHAACSVCGWNKDKNEFSWVVVMASDMTLIPDDCRRAITVRHAERTVNLCLEKPLVVVHPKKSRQWRCTNCNFLKPIAPRPSTSLPIGTTMLLKCPSCSPTIFKNFILEEVK